MPSSLKRTPLKRYTPLKAKTPLRATAPIKRTTSLKQTPLKKRKKSSPYKRAKDTAWELFSQYIRLRDCATTTGRLDIGICFTCSNRYNYDKLQAGHFIPGRKNKYLFDERQVHAQCMACNVFLHGNWPVYLTKMRQLYGAEEVEAMISQRTDVVQFKEWQLVALQEELKQKITALKTQYETVRTY